MRMSIRGVFTQIVFLLLLIFIPVGAEMEPQKPFSGSFILSTDQLRSDCNSNIYCIIRGSVPRSHSVYLIDLDDMSAKRVITLNSYDSDITIGKTEFAFNKVYWENPWSIVLHQCFTTPVTHTSIFSWKARTGVQHFHNSYGDYCFYAGDRLFMQRRYKDERGIPKDTVLFSFEEDGTIRKICEFKDSYFVKYESALLLERTTREIIETDKKTYCIYDFCHDRFVNVPQEEKDWTTPNIIIVENYLYISTNNRVIEYCLEQEQPIGTLIYEGNDGTAPDICYSDGCIFMYWRRQHVLQQYNVSRHSIIAEYSINPQISPFVQFIVKDNFFVAKSDKDNSIYVYCLLDENLNQIYLR